MQTSNNPSPSASATIAGAVPVPASRGGCERNSTYPLGVASAKLDAPTAKATSRVEEEEDPDPDFDFARNAFRRGVRVPISNASRLGTAPLPFNHVASDLICHRLTPLNAAGGPRAVQKHHVLHRSPRRATPLAPPNRDGTKTSTLLLLMYPPPGSPPWWRLPCRVAPSAPRHTDRTPRDERNARETNPQQGGAEPKSADADASGSPPPIERGLACAEDPPPPRAKAWSITPSPSMSA